MKNLFFLAAIGLSLFSSCSSNQALFNNETDVADNRRILKQYFSQEEPVLKTGDKITISIWGHDNLSIGSVNSNFSSNKETVP